MFTVAPQQVCGPYSPQHLNTASTSTLHFPYSFSKSHAFHSEPHQWTQGSSEYPPASHLGLGYPTPATLTSLTMQLRSHEHCGIFLPFIYLWQSKCHQCLSTCSSIPVIGVGYVHGRAAAQKAIPPAHNHHQDVHAGNIYLSPPMPLTSTFSRYKSCLFIDFSSCVYTCT